ncbi:MAG: hypothetical protein AABW48_01600 [Nanoarchaeota archaeon]
MKQHILLGLLTAALTTGCAYKYGQKPVTVTTAPIVVKIGPQQELPIYDFYHVCDKVELKNGDYYAGTPEIPATYSVRDNAHICRLKILTEFPEMIYVDTGCDNTLDYAYSGEKLYTRQDLTALKEDIKLFDLELKLEQALVCPKNRIE